MLYGHDFDLIGRDAIKHDICRAHEHLTHPGDTVTGPVQIRKLRQRQHGFPDALPDVFC